LDQESGCSDICCGKIESLLTRRSLLSGGLSALGAITSCTRPKAKGFSGYAFIANQEGGAVAAVDLEVFAVARHIRVDGAPTGVVARRQHARVYALTPGNGSLHEIRAGNLTFARKLRVAATAISMRLSRDENTLYVLCRDPRKLIAIALESMHVDWELGLAEDPYDFDVSSDGTLLAISHREANAITFVDLARHAAYPMVRASGEIGLVRFQYSRQLIAANLSQRMLSIYHAPSRRLIVNLPLAVRPDQLCFNADGGQLFVTGEGMDAVVVVYPSFTPEIGETVLAGHSPGAMAASVTPGYLFVANPKSGDVSILDIETRRVVAVTPVGTEPAYITITPDDQYALVLNQVSGDMAVIRIPNVTRAVNEQRRWKKGPLFMLIPVGSRPVSAAIMRI
jgi:YVTN family beta-propeller protein